MNKEIIAENFIIRNLETGFMEIHIKSKEAFLNLQVKTRELLKNKFRWSRPDNCWVSKADFDLCKAVANRFSKLGYKDSGWKGNRIPFEKKIIQRLNKNIAIADKYQLKSQVHQRKAAWHTRNVEHNQQLLSVEPDRFKKQELKRKIENAMRNTVTALERADYCNDMAIALLQRSLILELNLSNPKYLKSQLYKQKLSPAFSSHDGRNNKVVDAPLTDKRQADRLLFIGRFKSEQEETIFYKKRLRTVVDNISADLSTFYGKPVVMSRRYANDGIGRVVGHQPEDGKLVLKLTDGTYIAKELEKLKILAPAYEILNLLQSKQTDFSAKTKTEGLKSLSLIQKDRPIEAMQLIQKSGLSRQCLVKCDQFLSSQLKLKGSLKRSKRLSL